MADIIQAVKIAAVDAIEAGKPSGVYFGTVISASPLKINVEQKIILEDAQLILTRNVTEHTIEMTVAHETEDETGHIHSYYDSDTGEGASGSSTRSTAPTAHRHEYKGRKTYKVHKGLIAGETVLLVRVQGGQQYVVWDRVGR